MTPEQIKQMTYDDVKAWILANSEDTWAMDAVNRLTYPFTSKYAKRTEPAPQP